MGAVKAVCPRLVQHHLEDKENRDKDEFGFPLARNQLWNGYIKGLISSLKGIMCKDGNTDLPTRLGAQTYSSLYISEALAIALGIKDLDKKYNIEDMVKNDVIFCATGVTDGDLVNGIKDLGTSFQSETLVLHKSSKINKIIKNQLKK